METNGRQRRKYEENGNEAKKAIGEKEETEKQI